MNDERYVILGDDDIGRVSAQGEILLQVPVRSPDDGMIDADGDGGTFRGLFPVCGGEARAGTAWRELKAPFRAGDTVRALKRDGGGPGLRLRVTDIGIETLGDMTEEDSRRAGFLDVGRPEQWDAMNGGYVPADRLEISNSWVFSVTFRAEGTAEGDKEAT